MAIPTLSWTGQPRIKGSTESLRMFLLTASVIGLQFAWGTELTYCTPYLLSLGMSKSRMSLVWTAGPLSGLIVQPLVGMMSDKSTSKYGRRRPFMLAGTVAVGACYLVLGWAKEIAGWVVEGVEGRRKLAIVIAVGDIYVLDFVINVAQSTCKALIVDTLPIEKQQLGAAWVSRMGGIGHLMVYAIGALDLNSMFGSFLGDTQFKKVCVIAAIAMSIAQCTTAWAVQERVLVRDGGKEGEKEQSLMVLLSQTFSTILNVPDRIQAICWVQFWSWIGWFPVLFYGSTWVGEIYLRYEVPSSDHKSDDALNEVGRHGSMSLIVFSIVATICSIVLPWLIHSPDDNDKPAYTARPPTILEPVLSKVRFRKPSLLTAWAVGCLLFSAAMIWAPIVQSVQFATVLVALLGVSNAIATLSPATFLGVEVNRLSTGLPYTSRVSSGSSGKRSDSIELDGTTDSPPRILHLRHDSNASVQSSSTGELSGIYLGILNIYTTLPQFVGTAISWVVFSLLEPGKSPELAKEARPGEHHAAEGLEH
ncbi:uncharacterized protein LTR77_008491 [Saxophila tyrrhenica]|uniref:Uncharacterized protein n=1 Tax=Saxophila tyrrhenica TaxID=1690608 RepID=A0AAV9P3Y2_9PEZI|nr:hypothetical protein LTR77_008491 [Saxophila tyrrhenica]